MPSASTTATEEPAVETEDKAGDRGIDLQALAEKVYQLLKEEARLERERLG